MAEKMCADFVALKLNTLSKIPLIGTEIRPYPSIECYNPLIISEIYFYKESLPMHTGVARTKSGHPL